MPLDTSLFVPGAFWTPERARTAVAAMLEQFGAPQMQAAMQDAAQATDMEDIAASAGIASVRAPVPDDIRDRNIIVRRGQLSDIDQMAQLILAGNLPPMFIEPFLGGFAVAVCDEIVVACGGVELYEDCAFIRSIVADEKVRGLGLGRVISELLIEDARMAGARDCYLFTMDAHDFWLHLGFTDLPLDQWREPARPCWQYQFISLYGQDFDAPIYSMWKAL